MNFEFYEDSTTPWGQQPPHIAVLLGAAADGCSGLRSIALSGIGDEDDTEAMVNSIGRLSKLTALALSCDVLSDFSDEMTD